MAQGFELLLERTHSAAQGHQLGDEHTQHRPAQKSTRVVFNREAERPEQERKSPRSPR